MSRGSNGACGCRELVGCAGRSGGPRRALKAGGFRAMSVALSRAPVRAGHTLRSGAMGRVYAIANQKGGVGKTTTSVNLAASLAAAERRVLLVDMDPQGNAGSGLGVNTRAVERGTYDVLLGRRPHGRGGAGHVPLAQDAPTSPVPSWAPRSSSSTSTAATCCSATPSKARPPPLRLHPHRLPAEPGAAHPQRSLRGRRGAGPPCSASSTRWRASRSS